MADKIIQVRLKSDGTGYVQTIRQAGDETDEYAKSTGRAKRGTEQWSKSVEESERTLGGLTRVAGVAAGAVAAVFTASAVRESIAYAASIGKTADILGLTTTEVQEYGFAFQHAGIAQDEFLDITNTLQVAIGDAVTGTATYKDAFDALGVSYRDSTGAARSYVDVFPDLINGLRSVENATERAFLADELLGDQSKNLALILNQTGEEFRDVAESASEYGAVLSEDAITASRELSKEVATLGRLVDTVLAEAFAALAPLLTEIVRGLQTVVQWLGQSVQGWRLLFQTIGRGSDLQEAAKEIQRNNRELESLRQTLELVSAAYQLALQSTKDTADATRNSLRAELSATNEKMTILVNRNRELKKTFDELRSGVEGATGTGGSGTGTGTGGSGLRGYNVELEKMSPLLQSVIRSANEFNAARQREADGWKAVTEATRDYFETIRQGQLGIDVDAFITSLEDDLKGAKTETEELRDAFLAWSDVVVRLDQDWSNLLSTLLAGLAQVVNLSGQAKLNFTDLGDLVNAAGIIGTGGGIGGQLGQAVGGGSGSGLGALLGGVAGFAIGQGSPLGGFIGSTIGGFIDSIFGGGSEPSPEIQIGGRGTQAGRVAGTQLRGSPLGGLGIRAPDSADDFGAFRAISNLIQTTDQVIAGFLDREELDLVRTARVDFEITMDSDDQDEVSAAINSVFKNALEAVSPEIGEIFNTITNNLRIDPAEASGIAIALLGINDAFDTLGLTLDQAFIDGIGGAQAGFAAVQDYLERFFTPEEIAQMRLDSLQSTIRSQFGDIVDEYGVTFENFREKFEEATPEGEELARWLQLGQLLGLADDQLQIITGTTEDLTETTTELNDAEEELDLTRQQAIETLRGSITGLSDAVRQLDFVNETALETYIRQQGALNDLLSVFDGSEASIIAVNTALGNFQGSVIALVNSIDSTISSINSSISSLQLQIGLDALPDDQSRYNFLQDYIDEQTTYLAGLTDPQEIARVAADIQRAVRQQWSLLSPEERQRLGPEFIDFLDDLGDAATGALEDVREIVIDNANLTINAANITLPSGVPVGGGRGGVDARDAEAIKVGGADIRVGSQNAVFAGRTMVSAANKIDAAFSRGITIRTRPTEAVNG